MISVKHQVQDRVVRHQVWAQIRKSPGEIKIYNDMVRSVAAHEIENHLRGHIWREIRESLYGVWRSYARPHRNTQ